MADTDTQVATNGIPNTTTTEDGDDAETKVKDFFRLFGLFFDTSFLGNLAHEAKSCRNGARG